MDEIEEHYRRKHGYSALRYLIGPATFAMLLFLAPAAVAQTDDEHDCPPKVVQPTCDPIHIIINPPQIPHVHLHPECLPYADTTDCQQVVVVLVYHACMLVIGRPCL